MKERPEVQTTARCSWKEPNWTTKLKKVACSYLTDFVTVYLISRVLAHLCVCFLICQGSDIHGLLVCVLVVCCAISVAEVGDPCASVKWSCRIRGIPSFSLEHGSQTAGSEFRILKDD